MALTGKGDNMKTKFYNYVGTCAYIDKDGALDTLIYHVEAEDVEQALDRLHELFSVARRNASSWNIKIVRLDNSYPLPTDSNEGQAYGFNFLQNAYG